MRSSEGMFSDVAAHVFQTGGLIFCDNFKTPWQNALVFVHAKAALAVFALFCQILPILLLFNISRKLCAAFRLFWHWQMVSKHIKINMQKLKLSNTGTKTCVDKKKKKKKKKDYVSESIISAPSKTSYLPYIFGSFLAILGHYTRLILAYGGRVQGRATKTLVRHALPVLLGFS